MKTPEYIQNKIDRLPKGYVFTYEDFMSEVNRKEAVIKSLNRMASKDVITKLSKGRYFKPEQSPFGVLEPDRYQIVKDFLEKDGKVIGYLTGYSAFSELGLTTQIGNIIQIGRKDPRPDLERGKYKINFIRQKNTISKEYIPLLRILDAIRYIKRIPDATVNDSCRRLKVLLSELNDADRLAILRLAMKYPPSTRALLGALVQQITGEEHTPLKNSLNPITMYPLQIDEKVLPTAINWNIK